MIRRVHRNRVESTVTERLIEAVSAPGVVLLTGHRGSGKSHALRSLASTLTASGVPVTPISARDVDAAAQLTAASVHAIHLVDDVGEASAEVIAALLTRARNGGKGLCAITSDPSASESGSQEAWSALLARTGDLPLPRSIRLEPLSFAETQHIVVETSDAPLDASMLAAVYAMSWGRPAWLLELTHLAAQGAITAEPWPHIDPMHARELGLHTFGVTDTLAREVLTPNAIAGAVALAQLDPRSLIGLGDLVGSDVVASLLAHGILIPAPHDPTQYGVPELFAGALEHWADSALVARAEARAAQALLMQESLGIPLSDREAAYCTAVPDEGGEASLANPFRAHLFHRSVLDALSFGNGGECRDLLLRGASVGITLSDLDRARAATVLQGVLAGLRSIGLTAHSVSESDVTGIARIALSRQLLAESPMQGAGSAGGSARSNEPAIELLFSRWNDVDSIVADAPELARIAQTHPCAEVALLADQLLDFEEVKQGRKPHGTATCSERIARVTDIAVGSAPELRDLLAASAVIESMIALYMGDTDGSDIALFSLSETLPASAMHRAWIRHLGAAGQAIASGDMPRAYREWELVEEHLPRFLPQRLVAFVRDTGNAIQRTLNGHADSDGPASDAVDDLSTQLITYFSGRIDRIGPRARRFGHLHDAPNDSSRSLVATRLARAHVQAANEQNPAALVQVGEILTAQGFWAPAAFALQEARRIFVRRRATGSVNHCASLLTALEAAAMRVDPWFRLASLPDAGHLHLTPREVATARLLVNGLSNKEIAVRLRCSVRTVESHLAQARAKLGAADRKELGAIMRDFALYDPQTDRRRRADSRQLSAMR